MEVCIDPFQVCKRYFLPQDHLVESADKECVKETSMEDGQTDYPPNELEVVKMLRVDPRVRVDLEGIIVVSGVFEETIEGIEHFVGQKEEKFSVEHLAEFWTTPLRQLTWISLHNRDRLRHQT